MEQHTNRPGVEITRSWRSFDGSLMEALADGRYLRHSRLGTMLLDANFDFIRFV